MRDLYSSSFQTIKLAKNNNFHKIFPEIPSWYNKFVFSDPEPLGIVLLDSMISCTINV